MQTEENRMQKNTGEMKRELSLRELYYRGVFERKIFTVEDVLMDLHNKKIDADIGARSGDLDAASYEEILSEIRAAESYFHAGVSAAWFEDEGFEQDEEGHVILVDGEPVEPLPVEKVRESMEAFLRLMQKGTGTEEKPIPLQKAYEAGVFRYGDFTVEEAAVDVHNRLTDAYLELDRVTEAGGDISALHKDIAELKEAKEWADGELVKIHFLMADAKKDAFDRYTEYGGQPVVPVDTEKLRKEYEEYCRMTLRQRNFRNTAHADIRLG